MARATEAATILLLWPQLNVFHCGLRVIVASSLRCERTTVRGAGGQSFPPWVELALLLGPRAELLDFGRAGLLLPPARPLFVGRVQRCPVYPREPTFAAHKLMSALGHKQTSANKLRSCPTCFSWAVLQALELADDARITFTIALHGKHAREMLVEDSHRYHSIRHGWGPLDNPHDWEDAIAPLAKGERGRAFKAISPGMLPPLGIIFGLFCRVHWAVHTWERGQPREPLSRTGRCSITVPPPSRPFWRSRCRGSPAWSWRLTSIKRPVGGVESSREDRGDVEGDGRIASKHRLARRRHRTQIAPGSSRRPYGADPGGRPVRRIPSRVPTRWRSALHP